MASTMPSDAAIRQKMESLIQTVDLNTMSTKQFIAELSSHFNINLSSKKKFIKESISEIINNMDDDEEEDGHDDDGGSDEENDNGGEESEEEEEEVEVKPARKRSKGGGGGGGGGLQAVKEISDEMATFLNSSKQMARTAVVKGLWDYIKEHDLQNPNDKREILLDSKMQALFGTDRFDMFQMNKYVSTHIHPFPPLDLTKKPSKRKNDDDDDDGGGKKRARKKKGEKKQAGTQAPYRLSEDMAAVCGKAILPRPQVTQALWAYIRENNLQNPEDKREIICDEALKRVMGGNDRVTMFSMNKYM
eukprot:scaffold955_cov54-Cyclotella_meneghiniana.AAC.1